MQTIKATYRTIDVEVLLHHNTILFGYSGTGKTFLFKALAEYFIENDINYIYIDYQGAYLALDTIKSIVCDRDFILMDNADLYMTAELYDYLKSLNNYKVISLKDTMPLNLENTHIMRVNYKDNSLKTIEI